MANTPLQDDIVFNTNLAHWSRQTPEVVRAAIVRYLETSLSDENACALIKVFEQNIRNECDDASENVRKVPRRYPEVEVDEDLGVEHVFIRDIVATEVGSGHPVLIPKGTRYTFVSATDNGIRIKCEGRAWHFFISISNDIGGPWGETCTT